jgi:hypothetical protein
MMQHSSDGANPRKSSLPRGLEQPCELLMRWAGERWVVVTAELARGVGDVSKCRVLAEHRDSLLL